MNNGIEQVKVAFAALLNNISKPRRRLLYQQIGRELARSQRRRIKAQQNPDGSAYAPRKRQRKVKGKIKQKAMFAKITQPSHLKLRYAQEGVSLGFYGGDAAVADIHQFGREGKVQKHLNFKVKYDQRELLGFTDEDREMIEDFVVKALADG
ncbi:phage virion morphogenesis protein [Actinobacillus minor]|uniref:phage virion morphogenesis protein n=1 Tax=Actinobacillus minor TaxID=51047 RepID=UPI0026F2D3A1|nr:phage virion morphogenesis protein [Actinobacillus minor]